ncbi:hypothetical protein E4U41_004496 [Claviceps citrina]|nr:hypothetical protein E4U41_004496 [Claviceps citrina]
MCEVCINDRGQAVVNKYSLPGDVLCHPSGKYLSKAVMSVMPGLDTVMIADGVSRWAERSRQQAAGHGVGARGQRMMEQINDTSRDQACLYINMKAVARSRQQPAPVAGGASQLIPDTLLELQGLAASHDSKTDDGAETAKPNSPRQERAVRARSTSAQYERAVRARLASCPCAQPRLQTAGHLAWLAAVVSAVPRMGSRPSAANDLFYTKRKGRGMHERAKKRAQALWWTLELASCDSGG